jgi:hypothetical protein
LWTYYTVFVSRFGHKKPNREDVLNFFQNLGPTGQIITNSNENCCSYAFIRFKWRIDAYNVCHSLSQIKFKDSDILVVVRPQLCAFQRIETIATVVPIDHKLMLEKVLKTQDFDQQFVILQNELSLTESDYSQRIRLVHKLEGMLNNCNLELNCKFHIFSSTLNELGFRDTNIDVFIEINTENNVNNKIACTKTIELLREFHKMWIKTQNVYSAAHQK